MKTLKERIAVMQHFEDGGEIEVVMDNREWCLWDSPTDNTPDFNWGDSDYRIKQKARTFYIPEYKNGSYGELQEDTGILMGVMTDEINAKIIKLQEILE